jgi:cytoskeletal protein CcmA (bactofilin family)
LNVTEIGHLNNPQTSLQVVKPLLCGKRKRLDESLGSAAGWRSGRRSFFKAVVYASVLIFERALAVESRVQYTGSMIWKFKRSETSQASASAGMSRSDSSNHANSSSQGGAHSQVGTPLRAENEDVLVERADGAYVIPASYRIVGTLVTHRPVILDGELQGSSLVAPSVHVGKSGRLGIPTQAATITIDGAVDSTISARETVEVRAGGQLRGDVEAGGLSILPGGVVSGARLAIGPLRRHEG